MSKFLVLLLFVGAFAWRIPNNGRIFGGNNAIAGQFPYVISLQGGFAHVCGGSIINQNTILTAAHCLNGELLETLMVVAGTIRISDFENLYRVRSFTQHENYDSVDDTNDIALVHLSSNIEYNDRIQPITLSTRFVGADVECVFSGWGWTDETEVISPNLKYIDLQTISNIDCNKFIDDILDSHICTFIDLGNICHYDSGGPLVLGQEQIGIASWGITCEGGYPDVFTRVSHYVEWVNNNQNN